MIGGGTDVQFVYVAVPCRTCVHSGICVIEAQIQDDLVLRIVGVGKPVRLALDCSLWADRDQLRPAKGPRSAERRREQSERARRWWASLSAEERAARMCHMRSGRKSASVTQRDRATS